MGFIQKIPKIFYRLIECELPCTQDRKTIQSHRQPFYRLPSKGYVNLRQFPMLCGQTFVPLIDERLTSFHMYL